ncbi:aminoglycoside phosphotransferase family protein [Pararhizobium sp.]|uniref:aminoglycoside phosphotransferase family protein n=1 Tax=Pararhizobium sp. TaxID=1977563 RepID=UPI003D0E4F77
MSTTKMHDDELDINKPLVSRLIAEQFPDWAGLPLEAVLSAGTDNAIYRLGDDMAVRLPRRTGAAQQVEKESRWLPRLAPHLPLAVPVPLALGIPAAGYPFHWSVCRWLAGKDAVVSPIADLHEAAVSLSPFVSALQKIDITGGPPPGAHNFFRGASLASRDAQTRAAIESLNGIIETAPLIRAWNAALEIEPWDKPPVWLHGDIHAGNLLTEQGRLTAVIDFGGLGIGDPACDLMVGWNLLTPEARATFRSGVTVDDATWGRARGWALSVAVVALPYYLDTNPTLVAISRHAIRQVLADHADGLGD